MHVSEAWIQQQSEDEAEATVQEERERVEEEEEEEEEENAADAYTVKAEYMASVNDVNDVLASIATYAADKMYKSGKFNPESMLMMKLKVTIEPKARKGVKKDGVVKAFPAPMKPKAAAKTVKAKTNTLK